MLDSIGMPYAEAWRMLRPIAARLGCPRPSYPTVRRLLIAERRKKIERKETVERIYGDMFREAVPRL